MADFDIGKPPRAYVIKLGDSTHYPVLYVDADGTINAADIFPAGGGGGGISWKGRWNAATAYSTNDVVSQSDGLWIANQSTTGDPPDFYRFRGIDPFAWLASGVNSETTIDPSNPMFYDSLRDLGFEAQTTNACIVWGIHVTSPGDLVISVNTPVGTPALSSAFIYLFPQGTQNIGFQLGIAQGGAVPTGGSYTAVPAGFYFLVVAATSPLGSGTDVRFFVQVNAAPDASGGNPCVIGAGPTVKWDQMNREANIWNLALARGEAYEELNNIGSYTSASTLTLDFSATETIEIQVNSAINTINFSTLSGFDSHTVKRLEITQTGGGSLAATVWTSGAAIVINPQALPTNLGSTVNDTIIIWFYYKVRDITGSNQFLVWAPMAWVNVQNGVIVESSPAPTLFQHFADAGNVTTGETDLYSDTTAANQLRANGDVLVAEYFGTLVNNANTKRIRVYFAGTVILDSTAANASAAFNWRAIVRIIRESTTVVRCFAWFEAKTTALGTLANDEMTYTRITGLTLDTGTNIIKVTGQSSVASNDILAKFGTVEYKPA